MKTHLFTHNIFCFRLWHKQYTACTGLPLVKSRDVSKFHWLNAWFMLFCSLRKELWEICMQRGRSKTSDSYMMNPKQQNKTRWEAESWLHLWWHHLMLKAALVVNDPFIRLHRQKGCNTDSGASTRVISFQTNVQTPEKNIYHLFFIKTFNS